MKRIIALLLCLVMCLPLFVACNKEDEPDENTQDAAATSGSVTTTGNPDAVTTTPDESVPGALDKVTVNDWGGYTFKVYYNTQDNAQTDFICDSPNGDTLNDVVYARNTKVETLFNINIETTPDTETNYATVLQSQYSAGWTEGDYNMFTGKNRSAITLSTKGIVANLASYDQIDIYSSHWDQGYIDSLMINDALYSLSGAYSVKSNLFVSSICFNKNLFSQEGFDEPYDLVRSKGWTIDKMLEYMDGFAQDYNSDGYDIDDDRFALIGWSTEAGYGLFYGSGFTYCINDGETIELSYDRDRLDEVLDAVIEVWCQQGTYFSDHYEGTESAEILHEKTFSIFSAGRALFCDIVLQKIGTFFTNMENDYGILPQPMFSEDQGQYYSYSGYTIPLLLVPATDDNKDRTGNIIEAICAASNDIVIPSMFEIVTKLQNARDEDSAEMIEIIISTKFFDAAHWLVLDGFESLPRMIIREKNNTSSSYIRKNQSRAENQLGAFIEAYEKLEK